jgi:hypothetical protein
VKTKSEPSAIQTHHVLVGTPNSVLRVPETMIPIWVARKTPPMSRASSNAHPTRNPSPGWMLLLT